MRRLLSAPKARRGREHAEAKPDDELGANVGSLLLEEPNRVARIAIAGAGGGQGGLATGEVVEVIAPEMRGTAAWNTRQLLTVLLSRRPLQPLAAEALVSRIVSTLYEATRNAGKTPEDRALNYAATAALRFIRPFFRPGAVHRDARWPGERLRRRTERASQPLPALGHGVRRRSVVLQF